MPENYAELKLYFAYVSDFTRGEGRFEREPTSDGSRRAIAQARELIEQYLQPGWRDHGLHIGWSDDAVVSSEEEALSLISHAEANFSNASGMVIPVDRIHGSTRFHRVIRFMETTRDRVDEIVSVMRQSGHSPTLSAYERTWRSEEEVAKLIDEKWKTALKFY